MRHSIPLVNFKLITRLVYIAQKYNPVRSFTAEGTVGLGGPLVVSKSVSLPRRISGLPAVYPMESPGGYQIYGRSLPPWDVSKRVEISTSLAYF